MKDYRKILEGVVNIINTTEKSEIISNICSYIDENCPELKESEDERIRKTLIELINCNERSGYTSFNGVSTDSILAWLEKQSNNKPKPNFRERYKKMTESEWFKKTYEDKSCGIDSILIDEADETITIPNGYVATIEGNKVHIKREGKSAFEAINEKPVDKDIKIEPRFHKGEWVVNSSGDIAYIAEVKSDYYGTLRYYLEWVNGRKSDPMPGFVDNDFHLWNIEKEAKDGDVLVSTSHECYVIFKEIDGLNIKCYFTYHLNVGSIPMFYVNTLQNKTAFCPVSKEECKILFEKINEFGYKWDSENKKLIKI